MLAPTSNRLPIRTSGRRINLGSWSINSIIRLSGRFWPSSPNFFKLGLLRAKRFPNQSFKARRWISSWLKGSLKKSRSSISMPFCKSNSLTFRHEDQLRHQYNVTLSLISRSPYLIRLIYNPSFYFIRPGHPLYSLPTSFLGYLPMTTQ